MAQSQSLAARTRWLFTKEGLPVLISIAAGLVIGFFISGVVGLVLATAAGFVVLKLFNRLELRFSPWQAAVIDWTPVVGKLLFALTFLLPIASYLAMPRGYSPDTLPKYLSIVFADPRTLFSRPGTDIYPGFVFLVLISIVLMYWGSMNLEKRGHWLLACGGLALYTLSPTITGFLVGRPGLHIITSFFDWGFYFGWLGLLLLLLAKFLPRLLEPKAAPAMHPGGMLNLLPPVVLFGVAAHLSASGDGQNALLPLFDFESTHHFISGVFSGGVAATSSAAIVSQADKMAEGGDGGGDFEGEIAAPPEEPPDVPEGGEVGPPPEEPPDVPEGPVASTDPEDPPGTTITNNGDGSVTKTLPDGTTGTVYTDGTTYVQGPDGASVTTYPDGTSKEYSPEDGLTVKHPDGTMEITLPDGRIGGIVNNPDGSMDITSPYGGSLHCPKGEYPQGSLTTADGTVMTMNKDGSASVTSPYGGTMNMDKDGNMSGSWTDENGTTIDMKPDGSFEAKTADGDTISVDENGLRAKFKDGSFITTDADGNITGGHFTDEQGTVDISTDDKGGLHIKDDKGNSADINKDGSGVERDAEGNVATQDADGNATLTTKDGTTWVAKTNGTGYVQDKAGNRIDLHPDGSVTTTPAGGKPTHYTSEQVKQMQQSGAAGGS